MLWSLLTVFVVSFLLTWGIRYLAYHINMLDIPNDRSSHVVNTPRGGGIAFVIVFQVGLWVLFARELIMPSVLTGLFLSGILIASIGFFDDLRHIPAKYRMICHLSAGLIALMAIHGVPALHIGVWDIAAGVFLNMFFIIFLVWMTNLYNFMDGINGLASVEAISTCFLMAFIFYANAEFQLMMLPLLLGASVLGFLCWNFPHAKIFMGDVGSGFLGFTLGFFAILAINADACFLVSWLILLGVFIVDATFTLLSRLVQGDKIYQAHKSHAYQQAAVRFSSHQTVTLSVLAVNLVWLFPIAYLVAGHKLDELIGILVAYAPLIGLAVKLNAGKKHLVLNQNHQI
tara:strand:+ start:258 stop:1289 length:1032 start_codon:yes stop_codon:yes gene_type:complete